MKCDGMCFTRQECSGSLKLVNISEKNGKDWGKFYYCDTAIDIDLKNGFVVDIIDDTGVDVNEQI